MAIRTYSAEFNYVLSFEEDRILFKDLEQEASRSYEVDPEDAEQLHRITDIAITDVAAILGKIEEIRIQGSSNSTKLKRIDPTKIKKALSLILFNCDWRDVYRTIKEAKYHEIKEMCDSETPLADFEKLM